MKYESLPLPLAWDAFERKNGAGSDLELAEMIGSLRTRDDGTTPEIGCSILAQPFFWPKEAWIPVEDLFAKNIVGGKTFDATRVEGKRLWDAVQERLLRYPAPAGAIAEAELLSSYGAPTLVRPRRGQGTFRALVTNAYQRRCAITGEHTLPVLEAAHIRPFGKEGFNTPLTAFSSAPISTSSSTWGS